MGYDDFIEFALDCAETGNTVLRFPSKVGSQARFGYHRGRWVLVTNGREEFDAQSMEREKIFDAIAEDLNEVEVEPASKDRAWQWFINGPDSGEHAPVKSHCICGAFRHSTNVNTVQRWRRRHKQECDGDPSIIFPEDDDD